MRLFIIALTLIPFMVIAADPADYVGVAAAALEEGARNAAPISVPDSATIEIDLDELTEMLLESRHKANEQIDAINEEVVNRDLSTKQLAAQSKANELYEVHLSPQARGLGDALAKHAGFDTIDSTSIQEITNDQDSFLPKDEFVIFVSFDMHQAEVNNAFEEASFLTAKGEKVRVAYRGIPDSEPSIYPVIQKLAAKANLYDPVPHVMLDPETFREYKVEMAPAVMKFDSVGHLVGEIRGHWSPIELQKEIDRHLREKKALPFIKNDLSLAKIISEPLITDRILGEYAKIDIDKQKQAAFDRYWHNYRFNKLPRATASGMYRIDPSIIVEDDIINPFSGEIIRHAGTVINPLHIQPYNKAILIFDGTDSLQIEEALKIRAEYRAEFPSREIKLITTSLDTAKGNGWDHMQTLINETGHHIFVLTPEIVQTWQIVAVPSLITADDNYFYVREYEITE